MIKAWSSLRLHIQLALASGILLAITISITTWFNIQSQKKSLLDNTTREAVSFAKNISVISGYLVLTDKIDQLESLLIHSASFPFITKIKIISIDGKPLSHIKKNTSGEIEAIYSLSKVKTPNSKSTSVNWQQEKLMIWQPIQTSTIIAWIELDVSLSEVIRLQNEKIYKDVSSAIIAILIDLFILLLILYYPAKSFRKILKFSKNIKDQQGKQMNFPGGSFELDSLIDALNSSSLELATQKEKIQQQAENLITLNAKKSASEKEIEQKLILDSIMESVITINQEGTILSFNLASEKLFNYSASEIIGRNISQLMPDTYAHDHQSYVLKYVNQGVAKIMGANREIEGKSKNGDHFPMKIMVSELPKNASGERCFIGSCQDIRKIKQQEEQIRRSQKMDALGKLTGGIAHDYNNLLGIIQGYTELLQGPLDSDPVLQKYLGEIHHATERGTKLTQKLLNISRLKTENSSVLCLNNLLKEQQFMLEKTLSARIKLELNLSEDLWPVKFNSSDFEDTILNMSINAMHAIKKSGQLTIETQNKHLDIADTVHINLPPGDYVSLDIIDTGEGIKSSDIEKIFDPFYTTKGNLGTGLGLSQVYGFVNRSKGAVTVISTLGKGTHFTLYFPRCFQDIKQPKKVIQEPQQLSGSESLLIVDDEPAMVKIASKMLKKQGYKIFTANSGLEALSILESETIDLIVTDVIMPNMDGYELAAKAQALFPDIKIQIVTGFSDAQHEHNENKILHRNRLQKPYSLKSLSTKVRNLLDETSNVCESN